MTGYILSILGVVVAGIFIDVIIPTGQINKYIKSVYSIFIVAVLLSPLIKFVNGTNKIEFAYTNFEIDQNLIDYINNTKVQNLNDSIIKTFEDNGLKNIDIKINYSIKDNNIIYNSCIVNLENLAIEEHAQHINKYEFIKKVVGTFIELTDEEIIINE